MRSPTSIPAGEPIPVARIAGVEPQGRCPRARADLTTAVRLHRRPCFSFAGVRNLGEEFACLCLGRVLLFAADHGHPVSATALTPDVSAALHAGLQEIGALLPDRDRAVVLGASESLAIALREVRDGRHTPAQIAATLGISELAAESQLAVLAHWGLGPPLPQARSGHLSVAA